MKHIQNAIMRLADESKRGKTNSKKIIEELDPNILKVIGEEILVPERANTRSAKTNMLNI